MRPWRKVRHPNAKSESMFYVWNSSTLGLGDLSVNFLLYVRRGSRTISILGSYWKGLPIPPEPSARSGQSALKHAVFQRFSRVGIDEYVAHFDRCGNFKGWKTYVFRQNNLKISANAWKLQSYIAKNAVFPVKHINRSYVITLHWD